ncbi:sensor histidine kinase [Jiangella mangrovi]|uniref:Signal transduction histidine kinase n=1 Tax=Jiangella mangrovi TaxID=1524084 RepID=A0A7W9GUI2_9ACTN|nr:sensor histidine kinase [Jiangella mangrovi]MBB5790280.1 signal transduction histidine kinase [Jiangella mangrovi]
MRDDAGEHGWAAHTLDDSMQQAIAGGIASWQLVSIGAALASEISLPLWPIALSHLTVFAIAVPIVARRMRAWPSLVALYAATLVDFRAIGDPSSTFSYVTVWGAIITTATPILMIPRRSACWLSVLSLGVITSGSILWHTDGGTERLAIVVATAAALTLAAVVLMNGLQKVTRDTDLQEAAVAHERRELMVRRAVAHTAAEDARTLHDTMINTLSAVASGGGAVRDTALVRERCARDVRTVEAQLEGRLDGRLDDAPGFRLAPTEAARPLDVHRRGLTDDQLEHYAARVSGSVPTAVRGAVHELLRNAAKHSGADYVRLDVHVDGSVLIVGVSDDGAGFDGRPIPGRGLAESVVARARDAGIDVAIRTAPGAGTATTLSIPLDRVSPAAADPEANTTDAAVVVGQIKRTACWIWAAVLTAFGLASVVISRPDSALGQCLMLAVVGSLSLAAWRSCRDGSALPGWLTLLVVASIPLTFVASLVGVDFGSAEVNDWATITMTTPLILLLVTVRSKAPLVAGSALLILTTIATTYAVWHLAPSAAGIVPAGAAALLGLFVCWLFFSPVMDSIGVRREQNQRESANARAESAARDTVAAARARWTAAGVRRALAILRRIAEGDANPAERRVRIECAEAERHLRQVLLLNPEIVRMNRWIGQAMEDARSRSVSLTVRGCTEDAADEQQAESLGQVIVAAVRATPEGAELSLGLFPDRRGLRLMIVGPRGCLAAVPARVGLPAGSPLTHRGLGDQDLLELCVARPDETPSVTGRAISVGAAA